MSITPTLRFFVCMVALNAGIDIHGYGQGGSRADYERAASLAKRTAGKVSRNKVEAHWLPGDESFWYRNDLPDGAKEFVMIRATDGERTIVEDAGKLPVDPEEALKPRPSRESTAETHLRFVNQSGVEVRLFWIDLQGRRKDYGPLAPGETRDQHTFVGHVWVAQGKDGAAYGVFEGQEKESEARLTPDKKVAPPEANRRPESRRESRAFIRENNVWLRQAESGEEVQLSRDGSADDPYREPFLWSPDGKKLVVQQIKPAQEHKVFVVESSPADQLQPRLQSYDYLKAGDRIAHPRPRLFDVATRQQIPIAEDLFPNPWDIGNFHWAPDSSRFHFLYNQRGHQLERIISIDAANGMATTIVEERSATFIDYSQKTYLRWLDATGEVVWASERDGYNHLYLVNAADGAVKAQITRGSFNVRSVDRIDPERRVAWVRVVGVHPGEDPYHFHLARVDLDGSAFTLLTEGDGTHTWQWSPDKRWFIDTWSRVDQPPVIELRTAEGKRVCELERADAAQLFATGWKAPERFTAKGRDGATDIYGIIYRPTNFDPQRRHPVIEAIYAGPHDFHVPKAWGRRTTPEALAELGFIVVQIDGMGTNWRSRAFHDVCWKDLKDAGFPDRIAWMKAAASTRPWMDLSRVGIYGGSAGGQNAVAAVLHHGDFYKAAAADCGCHDNRMDKIWWNEAWMGWPVGPEYAENSNVTHAAKLKGDLFLSFGELDHNVDPASTMQLVNALMKADKDFELLIVPGSDHGAGERPYAARRRMDFFVRSLLGVVPRHE